MPARFQPKPRSRIHKEGYFCPLETFGSKRGTTFDEFGTNSCDVWDGYQFVKDDTMSIDCTIEKVDKITEGTIDLKLAEFILARSAARDLWDLLHTFSFQVI